MSSAHTDDMFSVAPATASAAASTAAASTSAAASTAAAIETTLTRTERMTARNERITLVFKLLEILNSMIKSKDSDFFQLHGITPVKKTRAEKKEDKLTKKLLSFAIHFTQIFGNSLPFIPHEKPYKMVKKNIREWNKLVNWWNISCANFRRHTSALTVLDEFIRDNPLPAYDSSNGFQSEQEVDEHLQSLITPVVGKVKSPLDGQLIEPANENAIGLWVSTHRTIFAALASEFRLQLMDMLEYLIQSSTVVFSHATSTSQTYDIYRFGSSRRTRPREFDSHGASGRFLSRALGPGTFFGCSLLLEHNDLKIPSSAEEICERIEDLPNGSECLAQYTNLCNIRIRTLLLTRRNVHDVHGNFIVCNFPGCAYVDGFMHRPHFFGVVNPLTQCPAGHALCQRCHQFHTGICEDFVGVELPPTVKRCPTCHTAIEKTIGCNHMRCTQCGQNFCWLCMMRFNQSEQYVIHDGPDGNVCPQYSDNINGNVNGNVNGYVDVDDDDDDNDDNHAHNDYRDHRYHYVYDPYDY